MFALLFVRSLLFCLTIDFYFFIQDPRRVRSVVVSYTTFLLVIGYALEATKLGVPDLETTGQLYYPVYKLAPYRILVTLIGVALAFIFTIFPYPLTAREFLRQDIAREFQLLSKMYSLTQTRMSAVVLSDGTKEPVGLQTILEKVGYKSMALMNRCVQNLENSKWEPSLRVRFPFETYAKLLTSMQRYP
jgi:hypothetical protein